MDLDLDCLLAPNEVLKYQVLQNLSKNLSTTPEYSGIIKSLSR